MTEWKDRPFGELLVAGDPAPDFIAPTLNGNPRFAFGNGAGLPTVVLILGSGSHRPSAAALAVLARHRALFDDETAMFFGITADPEDAAAERIAKQMPGIRWFLDYDGAAARRFGAADAADGQRRYRPHWLLLDAAQRVVAQAPIGDGERIMARLAALRDEPPPAAAPVLIVPRIFEPTLCDDLIRRYREGESYESGFMREEGGVTVGRIDHGHKRRSDHTLDDPQVQAQLGARLRRFLLPMICRAFQFEVTRIERWIVARYGDADGGGHFRAHRDNTTGGTAHRRFACTINLNSEDYEGGDLSFPEFGRARYRAPTGGAIVFSCSLLHEVSPVTRGERFCFLPFFYDEAAAAVRRANECLIDRGQPGHGTSTPAAQ